MGKYRFTLSGTIPDPYGKRLVVELYGDEHGDFIRMREEKRRQWVTLDIPGLYVRGLLAIAAKKRAERKAARRTK